MISLYFMIKESFPMPTIDLSTVLGGLSLATVVSAIVTLIVCLIVIRVVVKLIRRLLSKTRLEARVQKYIAIGIKAVLYLITIMIVLGSLNVDMTSLVALLSVASLGITLAIEDILANMAGGLVILSAHPFKIGDYISASGAEGTVEEITLNYTKLTTADGLIVMLPNKALADSQMTNYTALGRRRVTLAVTASYASSTEDVKAACMEAILNTANVLTDPAPEVYLVNYGDSSIEYSVRCWADVDHFWSVKFELTENLRTSFAAHNVEMTYEHLNVHIVEKQA